MCYKKFLLSGCKGSTFLPTDKEKVRKLHKVGKNVHISRFLCNIGLWKRHSNLHWLSEHVNPCRVTIRLPHIPDYNTQDDILKSKAQLETMGFTSFDVFEYVRKSGC